MEFSSGLQVAQIEPFVKGTCGSFIDMLLSLCLLGDFSQLQSVLFIPEPDEMTICLEGYAS